MNADQAPSPAPATLDITQINQRTHREQHESGSSGILLHDAFDAKEKLARARIAEEVVTAIMALGPKKPTLMSALVDCVCSNDTAKAIANRYSLHQSVLSYWSRGVGLPQRRRGRRPLLQPTSEHKRILELVSNHGIAETARRVGVSKQRIHQLVCRWEPRLKGRRRVLKTMAVPKRQRRVPRKIIVSFRISADEWQRLLAVEPAAHEPGLSGYGKARAIVLNYLAPPGGDGGEASRDTPAPTADTKNLDGVNVYNQEAA